MRARASRKLPTTAVLLILGVEFTGCAGNDAPRPTPTIPHEATATAPAPGKTLIGDTTSGGLHIDDGTETPAVAPRPVKSGRALEILLRSTPPGALAMVDGVAIGQTPVLWQGNFSGGEREFTFSLAGHSAARYRFVPISNGVVHGRLDELSELDGKDKGRVAPRQTPAVAAPPAPPVNVPIVTPTPAVLPPIDGGLQTDAR